MYDRLYEAIVTVRYPPRHRLSEKDLAADLGVSRTPVRDAIYRLAEEGLVEVFPQHGTFVARIDREGFDDIQFVREALERAALRTAMSRVTAPDIERMRENLRRQVRATGRGDAEEFFELDQALHQMIFECAGRPGAGDVARRVRPQLDRVRRLTVPDATSYTQVVNDHQGIVDGLESGDLEKADEVLTGHLRLILGTVRVVHGLHPDYFM